MTVADVHTQDITPYFNPSYDFIEEARNSSQGDACFSRCQPYMSLPTCSVQESVNLLVLHQSEAHWLFVHQPPSVSLQCAHVYAPVIFVLQW